MSQTMNGFRAQKHPTHTSNVSMDEIHAGRLLHNMRAPGYYISNVSMYKNAVNHHSKPDSKYMYQRFYNREKPHIRHLQCL